MNGCWLPGLTSHPLPSPAPPPGWGGIRLQITTHHHVWISTTTENQANPFVLQVTIASILERGVSNELASVLEWGVSGMF